LIPLANPVIATLLRPAGGIETGLLLERFRAGAPGSLFDISSGVGTGGSALALGFRDRESWSLTAAFGSVFPGPERYLRFRLGGRICGLP
jgi:hypothetical protein